MFNQQNKEKENEPNNDFGLPNNWKQSTKYFSIDQIRKTWESVKIGHSNIDVKRILGEPHEISKNGSWLYTFELYVFGDSPFRRSGQIQFNKDGTVRKFNNPDWDYLEETYKRINRNKKRNRGK